MHPEYEVPVLGKRLVRSPLNLSKSAGDGVYDFVTDEDRILMDATLKNFQACATSGTEPISFEKAGPREFLFFEPAKTKAAIVTCGGLCPGLNNVIRGLVMTLWYRYGVKRIIGIQYGYEGFISSYNHPFIELTPDIVENIHLSGGTILGSSRGEQSTEEIVDALEIMNVNILFTIGGDGTLRGAQAIYEEIKKRGLKISVGGIPKTIDNDIELIDRSFGFETASSIANDIIRSAHNEATGAYNGIALIKLMGRDSGFIAANAALSNQEVNFVLIPELDFDLYGGRGFLKVLRKRLEERHHALVVVAEGAGQHLFEDSTVKKDASGNILHKDIGLFLKEKIQEEFDHKKFPYTLKYIDPSYIIRSAPANANDSKFCLQLSQNAVHAAMAGKSGFVVGHWNNEFTVLPIPVAVKKRKKISLESELWYNVLETTGQPVSMKN
ncbi:MAG: ATP-dependent 6-phosphofructokinase [Bacteroidales bacterium]|jgi:6-phosphofructokinase 1|nr:ATP-dependent 6-phosphofructokinase [Bacteroidales bacterium]